MNSYETIDKVIAWYRDRFKSDPTRENITHLLAARRRLAAALYDIRVDVAEAKAEREKADFNRKRNYADKVLVHRQGGLTNVEAESKARLDNGDHEDAYTDAVRAYEYYRLSFSSVQEVLNAISSDLRHIEDEYKRANHSQPV